MIRLSLVAALLAAAVTTSVRAADAPSEIKLGTLYASSGRYASLAPLCPLRAVDPELTYYLGQALAEQVSLAPAEGPEGSVNADCVRLVEQAKRARVPR